MPKDIIDEILTEDRKLMLKELIKNDLHKKLMLKKLLENGLPIEELLTALFDQSGMIRVKAKVYNLHYEPERNELTKQISFLTTIIEHPAPDWMNDYREDDYLRTLEKLKTLKKSYIKKHDELYPSKLLPKGLTWKAMVGRKVVCLFNIIKPTVDLINKEAERNYTQNDIHKLIACLWAYTYGQFEGWFTHDQIKKLYDNNKSKIPIKI